MRLTSTGAEHDLQLWFVGERRVAPVIVELVNVVKVDAVSSLDDDPLGARPVHGRVPPVAVQRRVLRLLRLSLDLIQAFQVDQRLRTALHQTVVVRLSDTISQFAFSLCHTKDIRMCCKLSQLKPEY